MPPGHCAELASSILFPGMLDKIYGNNMMMPWSVLVRIVNSVLLIQLIKLSFHLLFLCCKILSLSSLQ